MSKPTVLYRFWGADGSLLYVGITQHIESRLSAHRKTKPWDEVANVTLEHHSDRTKAEAAERQAIQAEQPKWNIVHNNGGGSTMPTPQYADSFVGHFFHQFKTYEDGCRVANRQGHIVDEVSPGVYLVETYDWFFGEPYDRELVTLQQILAEDWAFYDSDEWMRDAYKRFERVSEIHHDKHGEQLVGIGDE